MNTTPLLLLFASLNSAECPLFTDEESKRNDEVFIVLEFFAGDPLWSHFSIFFSSRPVWPARRPPSVELVPQSHRKNLH